jgi:hypothetical protein
MLVRTVVERRQILGKSASDWVRSEIKWRVGSTERDQSLHQVVANSRPPRPEVRDANPGRLTLVDWALVVVAEFRRSDQRRVRVDLGNVSATFGRPSTAVVVHPIRKFQHAQQSHAGQPSRL